MAYGLQIWKANGYLLLDTSDNFFFFKAYISSGSNPVGATPIAHSVPGITSSNTEWAYIEVDDGDVPYTVSITNGYATVTNGNFGKNGLQPYVFLLYGRGVE